MFFKKYFLFFCGGLFCFLAIFQSPVSSQLPTIQDLILYSNNLLHNNSQEKLVASCVRIDGRCVFRIAFPKSELSNRINEIQYRLNDVKSNYLQKQDSNLEVSSRLNKDNMDIYVSIDGNPIKLLTITRQDATFQGMTLNSKAKLVQNNIKRKLILASKQRQPNYLIRQTIIGVVLLIIFSLCGYFLNRASKNFYQKKQELKSTDYEIKLPFAAYLSQRKKINIQDIKHRLLQISQFMLWFGGVLTILGLFPQARTLQLIIITAIRLPLRIILIVFSTYFIIRLLYNLINNLSSTIIRGQYVFSPSVNKRLQLRVNTISQVGKSIITILLIVIGFFFSLAAIGVDITPFLAGAGIIGLALSFASQSFIKDALNGFLIILEDQYAVGDIISLDEVSGMVENINLRITQLRDAEGRLITVPNGEIRIVANLSSQWSRADINIPLNYDVNLEQALKVIADTATEMAKDNEWQQFILETPQILGVEKFSDRAIIIRVWIQTEPLKQWDVSREFRRRLQIAFTNAGIPLTAPQQIWIHRETKS